jgi:hypothetical protein
MSKAVAVLLCSMSLILPGYALGAYIALSVSASSVSFGTAVTFTVVVKDQSSNPVTLGQVIFCDVSADNHVGGYYCEDPGILGTAQLTSDGTAKLVKILGRSGSHSVVAIFVGTSADAGSISNSQTVAVTGRNASTVGLTEAGGIGNYTLTATVAARGNPAPTGPVNFVDASAGNAIITTAALDWLSTTLGFSSTSYAAGTSPSSLAVGDFNGDGKPDLVVGSEWSTGPVMVLIGNGDGTFLAQETEAGGWVFAMAVSDFNGDGKADIVAVNSVGMANVLLGNGDGSFQSPQSYPGGSGVESVAVGDFNCDGKPDLVVTNFSNNIVSVLLGNGDGTFQPRQPYATGVSPRYVAVADFNGDGKPDLVVANQNDQTVSVLLGNGDGTFRAQQPNSAGGDAEWVVVGDFNLDGSLDLAVGTFSGVAVLLGNGDGTFQPQRTYATDGYSYSSLAVGDFNGDSRPDIVAAFNNGEVSVLVGNGDGSFQTQLKYTGGTGLSSVAVGDFNGDGATDVAVPNYWANTLSVLLSQWSVQAVVSGVFVPGEGETHTVFAGYGGDATHSAGNSTAANLTSSSPPPLSLSVFSIGQGFGTVTSNDGQINCGWTCSGLYAPGLSVTLTATPDSGASFSGWSGCDSSAANVCTVVVTANRIVTASFMQLGGSSALQFVPVTPCRVADTRSPTGTFGGPSIAGNSSRDFPAPQSSCGIPSNATAYSLNFTVVPHGTLGYLTVWPTGLTQPVVSTLNSYDGRIKANAAIVPAGSGAAISAFVTDTTDLIIDINGYFVGDPTQLAFYPLTPCRVLDTRNSAAPLGGPTMSTGQQRDFPVQSSTCNIPSTAQAYSLNMTVVPQHTLGYLTVWPTGGNRPIVSTLNSPTGAITANAAIVPAGSGGSISAFVTDNTDLIADINGYFAPLGPGGQSLYPVSPCRVLDTRANGGGFVGQMYVSVTGAPCAIPVGAKAFVLNSTVIPQNTLGYLTLWPDGANQPVVSTLNASDGAITSNMAIVPTLNGFIDAFTTNKTDLILDVFGYFAP